MSKTEHKIAIKKIEFRFKVAKIQCRRLLANAKDICMAEAKGRANVAMAELAARKHPGSDAHYNVHIAKAEAVYALTREKCDDLAGRANAACVIESEAARTSARTAASTMWKNPKSHRTAVSRSVLASSQRH